MKTILLVAASLGLAGLPLLGCSKKAKPNEASESKAIVDESYGTVVFSLSKLSDEKVLKKCYYFINQHGDKPIILSKATPLLPYFVTHSTFVKSFEDAQPNTVETLLAPVLLPIGAALRGPVGWLALGSWSQAKKNLKSDSADFDEVVVLLKDGTLDGIEKRAPVSYEIYSKTRSNIRAYDKLVSDGKVEDTTTDLCPQAEDLSENVVI
jgi:hypothetical protein